jgi:hypothetical protein
MNEIMKTIDKFAILLMLAAAFTACGQDPGPDPEPVDPTETRTLTFVIPDYVVGEGETVPPVIKTAWAPGDQIVVHGEYAKDEVVVTLEAGDISADGKTATKTVDGLHPYKRSDCASVLYASYPASAVQNLKHCFFYSAFKNVNEQLLAACNSGDTFAFRNVSALVSFKVKGDYDSFSFTARKDVALSGDLFQVKITDTETNLKQYLENPSTTIMCDELVADGETVNYLFVPGGFDLPGGYLLRFYKDGEAIMGMKDVDPIIVATGGELILGDVTDILTPAADDIDPGLATPVDNVASANCYILTEPGLFKFKAVEGNSDEKIVGGDHAEILWESAGNTEEIMTRDIIKGVSYDPDGNYMCFQIPNPIKPGNAVIAVLNAKEEVLWSWHIWIPKTHIIDVAETNFAATGKVMSRNLGALVDATINAPTPAESFGLLYQWGRKDPFPGFCGDTPVTVAGTPTTAQEGPITVAEGIAHPTMVSFKESKDWQNSADPSSLWLEASKTIYDPCPPGYQLPTRNKSCLFWSGNNISSDAAFNYSEANKSFSVGALVFPMAGMISDVDGALSSAYNIVWSGRWDSGTENGYGFNTSEWRNKGNIRSRAGSVRCVTAN